MALLKTNFFKGHERTVRAKKNIISLFFLKGYSTLITFLLIPITLNFLDEFKYGIWITLFNVLSWIAIFDIGLGNGLRNKFSEAIAKNNYKEAKEYVSTTYGLMIIISLSLVIIFYIPWMLIDWSFVFKTTPQLKKEISFLVGITFALTSLQFSLKIIGTILIAYHKPALTALLSAVSNTLILCLFFFFDSYFMDNLFNIGLIYTLIPLLVFIVSSILFFNSILQQVKPSFKFFNKLKVKSLFNLGVNFFIIQFAAVILFATDSMIITHVLNPEDVTSYNIVFRYFGIVTFIVNILLTPLWSGYTEAAAKKDYTWIKKTLNKQMKLMFLVVIFITILFSLAKFVIPFWLQSNTVKYSVILLFGMAIFTLISVWNNIFSFLLNGLSITNVQIRTSLIAILINIPLSVYLAKVWGNGGVILATTICLSFFAIFGANQAFSILKLKKYE